MYDNLKVLNKFTIISEMKSKLTIFEIDTKITNW